MSSRSSAGLVTASPAIDLHPIDVAIADAYTTIPQETLRDPWDRFIVATSVALQVPLVTRDGAIHDSALVETIW
jgi:PIN domain nuclease of toxin-antitoxin system